MSDVEVPVFSMVERDRRWDLARTFMEREGLDALLVFGEHEDAGPAPVAFDKWFTNGRAGTTVVFPRDGEPVSLFPVAMFTMDHLESTRRCDIVWITPENVRVARNSRAIADTLNELTLAKGTIGVVGGALFAVAPRGHHLGAGAAIAFRRLGALQGGRDVPNIL